MSREPTKQLSKCIPTLEMSHARVQVQVTYLLWELMRPTHKPCHSSRIRCVCEHIVKRKQNCVKIVKLAILMGSYMEINIVTYSFHQTIRNMGLSTQTPKMNKEEKKKKQ